MSEQAQREIPSGMLAEWQAVVDIVAELANVPVALIMRYDPPYIEVCRSSASTGNPYEAGDRERVAGLYCDEVIRTKSELLVPNALASERWADNPDIGLGMVSYLGLPLLWPDGVPFGTICVLDSMENSYSEATRQLMHRFQALIESQLGMVWNTLQLDGEWRTRLEAERRGHLEHLEELVSARTAEAQASIAELEAFAHTVSHDLRAPLRAMSGFSQALLEDYADQVDERGRDYMRRVHAASQRMEELIDDILELSRVGRQEMRRQTVDLSALAREVVAQLLLGEPDRVIEFTIADGLKCEGDPNLLRLVLQNLLDNAVKFTRPTASPRVEFGVRQDEGKPVFFVKDNGVGFDMAYADRLFCAFERLHSEPEFPGTGIGLATVQRIITRHGGRVWAESTPGEGATFQFSL